MRTVWATGLLLLGPAPAWCQADELAKAVLECAAIDSVDDRLNCFDSLARGVAKAAGPKAVATKEPAVEALAPGQWSVRVTTEPLDDTKTVSAAAYGKQHEAQVVIRCRQRKLDVLLSWNGRFLGATDPTIWTRIGTAKADKKKWAISGDHKAALLQGDVRPFLKELLSAEQLVVQTEHFAMGPLTDVFDVTKLREALTPLQSECRID